MSGLQPEDFSGLTYNVYDIYQKDPKKDLLIQFPKLKELPSFAAYGHGDRNYIIRYIIYLYDMKSPLPKAFEDLQKQKVEAALLAGYETDKTGKFKDARIRKVLDNEDNDILQMIFEYTTSFKSKTYAYYKANEHAFYENINGVYKSAKYAEDPKKELEAQMVKEKMLDHNEKLMQRMEALARELWGKDEELIEKIEKRGALRPEDIANKY